MENIKLNDGNFIPPVGIGTFMIFGNGKTERTVLSAIEAGYRHIDTAHVYGNEKGVGAAIRKCGLPREDIWVTSKLWVNEFGEGKTEKAIDKMLKRLKLDYLDLLLLHRPRNDFLGAWKDLEKAKKSGKVRSIGLSNFEGDELNPFLTSVEIKPSVLQVECHPYLQQRQLNQRIAPHGIVLESWYPLGHGDKKLLGEPLFARLGKKYGKSSAQVILRWHVQMGYIVFPKSTDKQHIKDNIDIFDFSLSDEEMAEIAELDCGGRYYKL